MRAHDVIRPGIPASGCLFVTYLAVVVVVIPVGSSSSWDGTSDEASARLLLTPDDLLRSGSGELCENARMQCTMRTGCQMGLNNFFLGCSSVINGDDAHCTTACKQALVSLLLATEDGAGLAFVNCNCSGHPQCELRKARVQVCYSPVLEAMAHLRGEGGSGGGGAPVSCGFARWICEADTSCLAALQYYVQHCGKLFHGSRCTLRCRNSVHILYRQPSAHKLRTCRCQGDEEYDCPRLVANTERLCFQKHRHLHDKPQLQQLPDSNSTEDDDSDDDFGEEGDAPLPRVGGGGGAASSVATGRKSDAQRQASSESSSPVPLAGQKEAVLKTRKRRNKPKRKKEKRGKKKKSQSESSAKEGRQKNGARKEGKKARSKRIRRSSRLSEQNGRPSSRLSEQNGSSSSRLSEQNGSPSSRLSEKNGSSSSRLSEQSGSSSSRLSEQSGSSSSRLSEQNGSSSSRLSEQSGSSSSRLSEQNGSPRRMEAEKRNKTPQADNGR